jgi:hypothetical protein
MQGRRGFYLLGSNDKPGTGLAIRAGYDGRKRMIVTHDDATGTYRPPLLFLEIEALEIDLIHP